MCGIEKNNVVDTCADDEGRSTSSRNIDEEGTHLLMAQGFEDEVHTFESYKENRSHWQDVFGSVDEEEGDNASRSSHQDLFDSEGEEKEDVEVDLECELVSSLEELQNARNDFKIYKRPVHEDCSQLRTCLHVSNQKVGLLTSQLEKTKRLTNDLKSGLDSKESERDNLRN